MFEISYPAAGLSRFIDFFWSGAVAPGPGMTFTHFSTASSGADLLFHFEGDFVAPNAAGIPERLFTAGLYGPTDQFKQYTALPGKTGIFGVKLYPHAIPALLSIPALKFTNESADIVSLLGREGVELAEKVFSADSFQEKISVVSVFFAQKIRQQQKYPCIEDAMMQVRQAKGQVYIPELIRKSSLSERQFERKFKEMAGFSLQSYARIVRFEAIVRSFSGNRVRLTELALDYGYFDQSHFNRDFKKFTGFTPLQYQRSLEVHPERLPDADSLLSQG